MAAEDEEDGDGGVETPALDCRPIIALLSDKIMFGVAICAWRCHLFLAKSSEREVCVSVSVCAGVLMSWQTETTVSTEQMEMTELMAKTMVVAEHMQMTELMTMDSTPLIPCQTE